MKQTTTDTLWQAGTRQTDRPCIWMQAGVSKKKNCNHYYDCTTCKFDAAMEKNAVAGRHVDWQDALRKNDGRDRTCRHSLTGRASHRTCPMNYNCYKCSFDQMLEDTISPGIGLDSLQMQEIKGFKMAKGCYFHFGHTWAGIDSGGFIRVGMDDFAFKVMGGPDGFELPLMGQELNRGKAGWGIKRSDHTADIMSPVNGVITKVNHKASKSPDMAREHPYEDGWLFTVHHSNLKEAVKDLMIDDDSEQWLDTEVTTLEKMIEEVAGPLSADGGYISPDVYGNLPALGWDRLANTFLRT